MIGLNIGTPYNHHFPFGTNGKVEVLGVPILKHFRALMCLNIGTPKNNKFSICYKWKIHYFQVSQNLGRVQPHYNVLEYWDN